MKIKIYLLLIVLSSIISAVVGCSSTSGSLRYNNGDEEKSQQNKEERLRYGITSTSSEDSLILSEEEDVPEIQDPSDLPDEEEKIDLSELLKKINPSTSESNPEVNSNSLKDLMLMEIIRYMDTPYKFGGNSLNGIDCSAFTQNVYKNSWMLELNRSAREQFKQGTVIKDRADLKFGDLVFFNTRRRVKPGHVGIYIGENLFAHASSKLGVTISSLDHNYYSKRYMGARRITDK